MNIRPSYCIIGILVFCAFGWLMFHPKSTEVAKIYKTVTPESHPIQKTRTGQIAKEERQEALAETTEEDKEFAVEIFRILRGAENRDPHVEKLRQAMDSSEYLEYLRKQDEIPGFDAGLYLDFLKSQGASTYNGEEYFKAIFRIYFPNGEPADYEPMMRKQLAEIALENPSEDRRAVLRRFWEDPANNLWSQAYFRGFVGVFDWADNIHQNADNIVAEFTSTNAVIDIVLPQATPTFTSEPSPTDAVEENGDILTQRENTVSLKDSQFPEELEIQLKKDIFVDIPNESTNANFENALRERFSPQRFRAAVQILNQYGPKEGIRRLKESDSEVATHIESLFQPNKETD